MHVNWTLIWLVALHVVGVSLFTRGFLLARLALPNAAPPVSLPPTHARAVLLIIDALRFDFVVPLPGRPNALSLPSWLSAQQPTHSLLFNAYADPPTTTLQRVKGITTGSLPTFIDIGSNFGASSVSEDSLLAQAHLAGKTLSFMGDDTWMGLFPDALHPNLTFPYDSFNVEDLHTVDRGVVSHLFPLLHDSSKPFDLLVGHFLGVDHVGHRLGPDHPSMTAKLEEMNSVIERVVDVMDNDTLLVVLGDHGMDRSGDHGGDGELETSAALWIYSKGPALTSPGSALPSAMLPLRTFPGSTIPHRAIQQIDILPTISLLLGLPIPFNNLGSVIPEIFSRGDKDKDLLERALALNANQIRTFLDTYRASASGRELDDAWADIQAAWNAIPSSGGKIAEERLVALYEFNRLALAACRAMWAQFNPVLMAFGLAVLASALVAACYISAALSACERSRLDIRRCALFAGVGALFGLATYYMITPHVIIGGTRATDWILLFSSLASSLALIDPKIRLSPMPSFPAIVIVILHTTALFSNSFTFWEDRIVPFLLASLLLTSHIFPYVLSAPTPHLRRRIFVFSVIVLLCVRLISMSTICREEQHPYCHVTFFASSSLPEPPLLVRALVVPVVGIGVPWAVRRILSITKSEGGVALPVLEGVVRPSLIAGTFFWIVEWVDSADVFGEELVWLSPSLLRSIRTWLARFAIGWPHIIGMLVWYLLPVCLDIKIGPASSSEPESKASSITRRQATVLGFANAYGAPYLMFWLLFYCIVHASVQLTAQVALAFALVAMLSFLEVVDGVRDSRAMDASFRARPSSALASQMKAEAKAEERAVEDVGTNRIRLSDTAPLSLLALLTFFATGHQSTVSSIQWKSAFLLSETVWYPFSPFTIVANSVGSVALMAGLGVPLVVLWNRTPRLGASSSSSSPSINTMDEDEVTADATLAGVGVMIYFGALLLGAATSAAVLRRHLMVWKVFAPRFMTAVVHMGVVDAGVLLGVYGGVRRVVSRVGRVFRGAVDGS